MRPPYSISSKILHLISSISEKIGEINAAHLQRPPVELRKKNRIKSIQSSLEIEGNTLSIEQVTDIFDNKRVLGPQKDILEVKNAILAYENLPGFKANKLNSFLKAHKILMKGLVPSPGKFRGKSVGIMKGKKLSRVAPPPAQVHPLMKQLFVYLAKGKEQLLIKSCVFHYELEFIHPFSDGNGRMGRLWQTVILKDKYPVFEFLPLESIIKEKQKKYYEALSKSDKSGNSTFFVEFMLELMEKALHDVLHSQHIKLSAVDRMNRIPELFGKKKFTRKEYLRHFKHISSATASRDLQQAVENGLLKMSGDKRTASYQCKKLLGQ